MSRITPRLTEELHERLRDVSHRTGASLNQVIVGALRDGLAGIDERDPDELLVTQVRLARAALNDLAVDLDAAWLGEERGHLGLVPMVEELIRSLPRLTPSLSATVIAEREDRI